jgi:hypothetical protein
MGLAMAQAAIFSTGIPFAIKLLVVGCRQADVYDLDPQMTDYSGEFSFGFNVSVDTRNHPRNRLIRVWKRTA